MGISTIQSYTGAQIFEALGLSKNLVEKYFTWTVSRIGGIGLEEIYKDINFWHKNAFAKDNIPSNLKLDIGGLYLWRSNGERHMWKPETISLLQDSTKRKDKRLFDQFEKESDNEGNQHISFFLKDLQGSLYSSISILSHHSFFFQSTHIMDLFYYLVLQNVLLFEKN